MTSIVAGTEITFFLVSEAYMIGDVQVNDLKSVMDVSL